MEGERAVRQVLAAAPDAIEEVLASEALPADFHRFSVRTLEDRQLRAVSTMTTPQGLIGVLRIPEDAFSDRLPDPPGRRILLLEDVQDPGNVGTLIRTAAAFGYSGVLMSARCADPFSPKAVQATAGSVLSVWIRRTSAHLEMIDGFRERGFFLVAMDLRGEGMVEDALESESLILALGSEATGLSEGVLRRADARVRIPVADSRAESLNVAACGAVCMYISSKYDHHRYGKA